MADNNDLYKAYSILGSATTAEYNRRRKEEDEYRRKARKDKYLSYLAAPLLKGAGNLITSGVESLIVGPEEKKYSEFLQSEQVMAQRHHQKVLNKDAEALQVKHKKALENETGVLNYYTNVFYEQDLNNFNREHPEEEYSEGKNGVFWQRARERAEKALPIIEQAYARSLDVRTPEELDAALSKAYGSRDILSVLGRAVTNPFKGTKREDIRQQRLDFLQQQKNLRGESIRQAMSVLGQDTSVAALAGYAADVEEFKIKREDYILKGKREANYTVNFDDSDSISVKAIEVTYQHPNDPTRTVTEWMPIKGNERSERVLAQARSGKGTILEDTVTEKIDSGYGYTYTKETTTKKMSNGIVEKIIKNINPETMPPTQAALKATGGDIRTAGEAYNSAAQVITTPFVSGSGKQLRVLDSQIAETVLSQGLGGEQVKDLEKRKEMLYANIHGYSVSLQSRMADVLDEKLKPKERVSLDKDAALTLSAVAQARYFGGLQGKEGSYIKNIGLVNRSPNWADIDFDSSTGLNPVNFRKAGSVYALDAFFAAEETGIRVSLTPPQFDALLKDAIDSFYLLPASNRNQFLTYFKEQEELQKINPITKRAYFFEFDVQKD